MVAAVDIPAATQLFTPNWIVKYLVQNSLGAQWLATYPHSPLKGQMDYYIEPAEQIGEVKAQLAAITSSTLNPEALTLIDPASGSGHILVEAYDLFKAIYLERGYRQQDVTQLILEKNLFGLDIDARAAQLTGFALMMKGRADDRRLFERGVKLNVMALVDSTEFNAERLAQGMKLADYGLKLGDLTELMRLFVHATTFGSLIHVPEELVAKLPALKRLSETTSQDLFVSNALKRLGPLVQQAGLLAAQYDAVVANPPYMGSKFHIPILKKFLKDHFPDAKSDFFACFIERGFTLAKDAGHNGMVTMESWMFLSSYEKFRNKVLHQHTLRNLAHFPYDGKQPTAMGINFGVAATSVQKTHLAGYLSHYCCSRYYELNDNGVPFTFPTPNERLKTVATEEFKKIPGGPVAYWVSTFERDMYVDGSTIDSVGRPRKGIDTGENAAFLRLWWEVSIGRCSFANAPAVEKWFPYNKGGDFRRWYGNRDHVINWLSNGSAIKARLNWNKKKPTIRNSRHFFREGFTWTTVSSGLFSIRYTPYGAIFDNGGCSLFCDDKSRLDVLGGLLNSKVAQRYLDFLSPTLNFQPGDIGNILYWSISTPPATLSLLYLVLGPLAVRSASLPDR